MATDKKRKKNKGVILIKKSNNLIESRYRFDIWETRFFLAVLAQINIQDDDFKTYRVWYKDVIKTFGLKSGDSYSYLREAAQSLMGKSFFVKYEEDGVKREKQYHILREIDYLQKGTEKDAPTNQEYIDVQVEQKMKSMLLQLKKNFTAYDLRNVVKLGVYPVRIYELLKQYQSIGHRTLRIEEMKEMLEVKNLYKNFSDFYRWVVKPSIKQINDYTDLLVTNHIKIKEGRRYAAIKFEFKTKAAVQAQIKSQKKEQINADFQIDLNPKVKDKSEKKPLFDELYPDVKQWIGVETFGKLLSRFPEKQVRTAISITLNRLKKGDQIDNIGGHIISLSRQENLLDTSKLKKDQARKSRRVEDDKANQLLLLLADKKRLAKEWSDKELAIIEMLFVEHPDAYQTVFDKARQRFSRYENDKTESENLQNPLFAATFRNIVKKDFPDHFQSLNLQYEEPLKIIQQRILSLS